MSLEIPEREVLQGRNFFKFIYFSFFILSPMYILRLETQIPQPNIEKILLL